MLAAVLSGVGYSYYATKKENAILRKDVNGLNTALLATMDTTRNQYNQMRAQVQTVVLSEDASNRLLSSEIKNIKTGFGVKLNGIESYTKAGLKYSVPVVVKSRDTIIINKLEKVYTISGENSGTLYTRNDSLFGNIRLNDTVRITVSKGKRERWWKFWTKRPLVTNAYMSNRGGTIVSLNSILVK